MARHSIPGEEAGEQAPRKAGRHCWQEIKEGQCTGKGDRPGLAAFQGGAGSPLLTDLALNVLPAKRSVAAHCI